MSARGQLSECELVVITIIENVDQISVEGVKFVKNGEIGENLYIFDERSPAENKHAEWHL